MAIRVQCRFLLKLKTIKSLDCSLRSSLRDRTLRCVLRPAGWSDFRQNDNPEKQVPLDCSLCSSLRAGVKMTILPLCRMSPRRTPGSSVFDLFIHRNDEYKKSGLHMRSAFLCRLIIGLPGERCANAVGRLAASAFGDTAFENCIWRHANAAADGNCAVAVIAACTNAQ